MLGTVIQISKLRARIKSDGLKLPETVAIPYLEVIATEKSALVEWNELWAPVRK